MRQSNRPLARALPWPTAPRRRSPESWLAGACLRACELVLVWQERSEQRRALATLDDRLLRDIGLSRADIERETAKPFWQP